MCFATISRSLAVAALFLTSCFTAFAADYVIVVSKSTQADAAWAEVVAALQAKHDATVVTYDAAVGDSLAELGKQFPRYTCFVATSKEANRDFVRDVHKLTRKFDSDPYTDTLWGILTGFDASDALRIAKHDQPLQVRKVASGTELAMEMIEEGVWTCELNQHKMVQKTSSGEVEEKRGPADTTKHLVDTLNEYHADLFVTSGHATERNWQIGFRYKNGYFKSKSGQLSGHDTKGEIHPVDSSNPKVYLPIGNCLMGNIDGPDAMALAWMHSAGVHQMIGYTVPTWFGYGGWGCLDYFVEQPGRYTFAEAFHANHHALNHRLAMGGNGSEQKGLEFDRDVVALYGDPAWDARMADRPKAYEQSLTEKDGVFTLSIKGSRGAKSFAPVNMNGSQRGGRPMLAYLPFRIQNAKVVEGEGLNPVVADDFVLVPNPKQCESGKEYVVRFTGDRVR